MKHKNSISRTTFQNIKNKIVSQKILFEILKTKHYYGKVHSRIMIMYLCYGNKRVSGYSKNPWQCAIWAAIIITRAHCQVQNPPHARQNDVVSLIPALPGAWRVPPSTHQNLPLQPAICAGKFLSNRREEDKQLGFFKFNISSFTNFRFFSLLTLLPYLSIAIRTGNTTLRCLFLFLFFSFFFIFPPKLRIDLFCSLECLQIISQAHFSAF